MTEDRDTIGKSNTTQDFSRSLILISITPFLTHLFKRRILYLFEYKTRPSETMCPALATDSCQALSPRSELELGQ